MNKIDRFCYAHPRFGIPNLMLIIVIGNAAVWLLTKMDTTGQIASLLCGSAQGILHGQVWRLVTYVFVPTEASPIWLLVMLYFYYWIGSCLEREWGNGKFTIYYVSGMLLTAIYGVVLSAILGRDVIVSTTYLNLSMFFAFATSIRICRCCCFSSSDQGEVSGICGRGAVRARRRHDVVPAEPAAGGGGAQLSGLLRRLAV